MAPIAVGSAAAAALLLLGLAPAEARLGGNQSLAAAGGQNSSLEAELAHAAASLLPSAFARGSKARQPEFWAAGSVHALSEVESVGLQGHEYLATTTRYGDTCCSGCGGVDTVSLVKGTDYYAVASAQSMQNLFPEQKGGKCCWCGKAGPNCGHGSGTAPMGCSACAEGRFVRKLPYKAPVHPHAPEALFEKTFKLVVADICPFKGNEAWCPERAGERNTFGVKNHFDFAAPPAGFDNYYFVFTPTPCPQEISLRLHNLSQCTSL